MIAYIFYSLFLFLFALFTLPKLLYHRWRYGKNKENLLCRLGVGFPNIVKGKGKLIWIHAVSVGETKGVAVLAKQLKEKLPDAQLVISNITETGHAEAKRSIPFADYHVYLPLDFDFIIRPIIKKAAPDLVIITETDFWYNFLNSAKQTGATVAVVNGKMSERSCKRYGMFKGLAKRMFGLVDLFCVQSSIYADRFISVGIPKEKVHVTGNLKFDTVYKKTEENKLRLWKQELGVKSSDQVFVIGSSHDPEEKILLTAIQTLMNEKLNLKVLLVPRHPERFDEVFDLLKELQIPAVRLSTIERKTGSEKVILIDAMGLLTQCYQIADVALVAGSFTEKVGGHNIMEPSGYGIPVLFGPYMYGQPEMQELVLRYEAGEQVKPELLGSRLKDLLKNKQKRTLYSEGATKLTAEMRGSTEHTCKKIITIFGRS